MPRYSYRKLIGKIVFWILFVKTRLILAKCYVKSKISQKEIENPPFVYNTLSTDFNANVYGSCLCLSILPYIISYHRNPALPKNVILSFKFIKNIPVVLPSYPIKIWGKSVKTFLGYSRTYKQTDITYQLYINVDNILSIFYHVYLLHMFGPV